MKNYLSIVFNESSLFYGKDDDILDVLFYIIKKYHIMPRANTFGLTKNFEYLINTGEKTITLKCEREEPWVGEFKVYLNNEKLKCSLFSVFRLWSFSKEIYKNKKDDRSVVGLLNKKIEYLDKRRLEKVLFSGVKR